jgi:hypothetical protein
MDDLLIKYILEETSPEESGQAQQWLAANDANRTHFEKLQAAWQLAAQPNLQLTTGTPQALQRLKQTLQARQTAPVKRIWSSIGTAAAAVVAFAGVMLGAYVITKPKAPAKKTPPVVHPHTGRKKLVPVDTMPVLPTDTIPIVQPHKKKRLIPVTPVQPIPPVDSIHPVPAQSMHGRPIKKRRPMPELIVDTTHIKKKHPVSAQPVQPVRRKHKS